MTHNATVAARVTGALYGMYIGDALSMPVHWYYDRRRIFDDFGAQGITKYEAPMSSYPGSIMNLSNTGGGGRGDDENNLIGDVLVKGKKKYWLRGGSYHYHHGMSAGENTLDTLVARLMLQTLVDGEERMDLTKFYGTDNKTLSLQKNAFTQSFLEKYIQYMTTKDSHNDVYVATAHRQFFANLVFKKLDPLKCADNDGHNTDAIDGLINVGIVSLNQMTVRPDVARSTESMVPIIHDSINLLRKSKVLVKYGEIYHRLLIKLVLDGKDLREAILEICEDPEYSNYLGGLNKRNLDRFAKSSADDDPMSACYIKSNFPVTLLLAYKYNNSVSKALLANANAGGENVNRGAILGTIIGAALGANKSGQEEILKWKQGLTYEPKISPEVAKFVAPLYGDSSTKHEL